MGRFEKTWDNLERHGQIWEVGKILENMGRFGKTWEVLGIWEDF